MNFLATLNSPYELGLKDLTVKLTTLLALTSAARVSEIGFLDTKYLNIHLLTPFILEKNAKTSKKPKPRDPIKFYSFKETNLCVCQRIDLHLKRPKETREQNPQLLLSFVKSSGPVSTPTISRWILIVLNLSGTDTETFIGHSTRTASSSKAKLWVFLKGKSGSVGFSQKYRHLKNFTIKKLHQKILVSRNLFQEPLKEAVSSMTFTFMLYVAPRQFRLGDCMK